MPRGKLVDRVSVQAYRAPEAVANGGDPASPEFRIEEAIRAGFAQGLQRGRAEAQTELDAELARVRAAHAQALAELAELKRQVLDRNRKELLELAVEIASRIVRARIADGEPVAERVATEILRSTPLKGTRVIRVNPDDHAAILTLVPELAEPGTVEVTPDGSISPGGLVVEDPDEVIDARIETALDVIGGVLDEER